MYEKKMKKMIESLFLVGQVEYGGLIFHTLSVALVHHEDCDNPLTKLVNRAVAARDAAFNMIRYFFFIYFFT